MRDLVDYALTHPLEYIKLRDEISAFYPFAINHIQRLREKYSDLPITELINQITLQKRALAKLPYAERWLWTDKNYQQASTFHLALYHGSLFSKYDVVADLCCGIGSDLLFLSKGKSLCCAVDSDEQVLKMARYNMSFFQRNNIAFSQTKAENFSAECDAVFIDPDRRYGDRRYSEIEKISPCWDTIKKIINRYKNTAIKLSPILDFEDEKFSEFSFHLVSVKGELKECLLLSGNLSQERQAVLLPQNTTFAERKHPPTPISPISKWLFEPDSAIIRGHLVNDLAFELGMSRIDEKIALLTSDAEPEEIYGTRYRVIDSFDYNLKTLNQYLKQKNIGILDIKTRGFSEPVETFRKHLWLKGQGKAVLFIVRIGNRHKCTIA